MTYEQKLEAVKAEIVKVMPELKDLKIGTICKGKNSNEDFVYLGHNFWQAVRNGNVRLHESEAGCPVF